MGNNQNIIELNGKHFDAVTGHMLGTAAKHAGKPGAAPKGLVMDGVVRHKASHRAHVTAQPHHVHKQAEKSKTLMRDAVKKPGAHSKPSASANVHKPHPDTTLRQPTAIYEASNRARTYRAEHTPKSKLISKFGSIVAPSNLHKKIAPLPVQPEPTSVPELPENLYHHPAQLAEAIPRSALNTAFDRADSHEQPKPRKTKLHHKVARKLHVRPKALNIGAALLVTLVIGGFFAYQNISNLAMRVAVARSGVHGSLPDYQPAGFDLAGPIEYKTGQITLNFKSNSDGRNFKVVQESSQWNSDTLRSSLAALGKSPLISQERGKTVYIYDGNASWVSGGIKYHVEGNSSLSSDQLYNLVNSF